MNNSLEIIRRMVDDLASRNIKILAPIVLELTAKDWNEMSIGIEFDRRVMKTIEQDVDNFKLVDTVSYINGYVEVSISKKKALKDERVKALKEELEALGAKYD